MTTLTDLEKIFTGCPKMLAAITQARKFHADTAQALIATGKPSFSPNSNCYKSAVMAGFPAYDIYPGARRRYRSEGYVNVVVRIGGSNHE